LASLGRWKEPCASCLRGEFTIGRDAANQLWVDDAALSRRHCVVRREGSKCIVRDAGSRNGTRLNGVPVEEQQLEHWDQLSIGLSVARAPTQPDMYTYLERRSLTDTVPFRHRKLMTVFF
jgi:pSer/pThr/pTyr-binding forkhead associated (FHA) protein